MYRVVLDIGPGKVPSTWVDSSHRMYTPITRPSCFFLSRKGNLPLSQKSGLPPTAVVVKYSYKQGPPFHVCVDSPIHPAYELPPFPLNAVRPRLVHRLSRAVIQQEMHSQRSQTIHKAREDQSCFSVSKHAETGNSAPTTKTNLIARLKQQPCREERESTSTIFTHIF